MVFLVGFRLLGDRCHDDPSLESNMRRSAGDTVEQLARDATGGAVVHQDAEVHPLVPAAQVQALERHLRPFADQVDGDVDVPGLPGQHDERQFELLPRSDGIRFLRSARNDTIVILRSAQRDERIYIIPVSHR